MNYQTKNKDTASKLCSKYFRQLLYGVMSLQKMVLRVDFVSWQIVREGTDIFTTCHANEIHSVTSLLKLNRE